jgi:thiazole synthase ThiGH ThiG subunit
VPLSAVVVVTGVGVLVATDVKAAVEAATVARAMVEAVDRGVVPAPATVGKLDEF